jgi:uncharacterized protein
MKRILLVIALLGLCAAAACKKTETAQSVNGNSAHAVIASGDKAETQGATGQTTSTEPQTKNRLPPPTGHVNDYAAVIDDATKMRMERVLENLQQRAEIGFAVVTVKTTGGEDIFAYSLAVAREWGVGAKPRGDGVLLLVSVDDRKWRVQVTRGLEADLPEDVLTGRSRQMVESFRAGEYGEGLTKYVAAIIERLKERRGFKLDESLDSPPPKRARS